MSAALLVLSCVQALEVAVSEGIGCPSSSEITRRLEGLVPAEASGLVQVEPGEHPARLRVRLTNERGERGERSVPAEGRCEAKAEAIAVVVAAAWAQLAGPPPSPPAPPVPMAAKREAAAAPSVAASANPRAPELAVGAGTFLSLASGGVAPGVRLEVGFGADSFGFRVAALWVGAREQRLADGVGLARRLGGALGLSMARDLGRARLGASLEAWLTGTEVSGQGFTRDEATWAFHPAAAADVRVGRRLRSWLAWLSLGGVFWLREQGLFVRGVSGGVDVPRFEVLGGLGVSFLPAVTSRGPGT